MSHSNQVVDQDLFVLTRKLSRSCQRMSWLTRAITAKGIYLRGEDSAWSAGEPNFTITGLSAWGLREAEVDKKWIQVSRAIYTSKLRVDHTHYYDDMATGDENAYGPQ